jgi:hypothetical protein
VITTLSGLWCPRCAAGLAARQAFWDSAPLSHLAVALVPFVVVVLASLAAARFDRVTRFDRDAASTGDAP